MIDPRHDNAAERFGMARKRGAVLVIASCALLGAPATAHGAKPSSQHPVSPRYQAISCDTAAGRELAGGQAAATGPMLEQHPRIPASFLGFPARERRATLYRYQSRQAISNNRKIVSSGFFLEFVRTTSGTCADTANWIPSKVIGGISPGEARFLLQLGVAFAAAYVLFLAVWFWSTRERRSRVGSAVRS